MKTYCKIVVGLVFLSLIFGVTPATCQEETALTISNQIKKREADLEGYQRIETRLKYYLDPENDFFFLKKKDFVIPIRVENQRKFREDLKAVVNLMRWLTDMERDPKYDRGDIDNEINDFIKEIENEHYFIQTKLKRDLETIRNNIKAVNKDIDRLKMAQEVDPKLKRLKGSWEFGRKTGPKDKGLDKPHRIGTVTLTLEKGAHGKIIGGPYRHDNECFWELEGNTLSFKHKDGTVTTTFSPTGADWNNWEGEYIPNREPKVQGVIHYLKRK